MLINRVIAGALTVVLLLALFLVTQVASLNDRINAQQSSRLEANFLLNTLSDQVSSISDQLAELQGVSDEGSRPIRPTLADIYEEVTPLLVTGLDLTPEPDHTELRFVLSDIERTVSDICFQLGC